MTFPKWGRAACIGVEWAAPISVRLIGVGRPSSQNGFNDVHNTCDNSSVIDLYAVGDEDKAWETLRQKGAPFVHWLILHGPQGKKVRTKALFDRGVMVGAMCTSFFTKNQHQLCGQTKPSDRHLRMANRTIIQSEAVWNGVLELGGIRAEAEFEIFDSRGSWEFLFRKPLLHRFRALHDFDTDTVTIRSACESVILCNTTRGNTPTAQIGVSLTLDVEQQEISAGGSLGMNPPQRQVSHTDVSEPLVQDSG